MSVILILLLGIAAVFGYRAYRRCNDRQQNLIWYTGFAIYLGLALWVLGLEGFLLVIGGIGAIFLFGLSCSAIGQILTGGKR